MARTTNRVWTLLLDRGLMSREYVTPLNHPVAISTNGYDDGVATHVGRWYNRTTGDWVVFYSTAACEQVGASTYVATLAEAHAEAERMIARASGQDIVRAHH